VAESDLDAVKLEMSPEDRGHPRRSLVPAARLVEIWNSLPGVTAVTKFKDRKAAVTRIWKAIQSLGEPVMVDIPGERSGRIPATEPVSLADQTGASAAVEGPQEALAESPEPFTRAASVSPQTPDVAPQEAPAKTKASRAKKEPKPANRAGGPARAARP
jgi:hypothetical protein